MSELISWLSQGSSLLISPPFGFLPLFQMHSQLYPSRILFEVFSLLLGRFRQGGGEIVIIKKEIALKLLSINNVKKYTQKHVAIAHTCEKNVVFNHVPLEYITHIP